MRPLKVATAVAAACFAALVAAAAAPASDFADAACRGDVTIGMICPPATVGQSYAVEFTLKEPGDACPTFKVSSGGLPPGLSKPVNSRLFGRFVSPDHLCSHRGAGVGAPIAG